MKLLRARAAAVEIGLIFLLAHGLTAAADIIVLSAVAMRSALDEIAPRFERTTGHRLMIRYAFAGELRERIERGEVGDVSILPRPWFEPLREQGRSSVEVK